MYCRKRKAAIQIFLIAVLYGFDKTSHKYRQHPEWTAQSMY